MRPSVSLTAALVGLLIVSNTGHAQYWIGPYHPGNFQYWRSPGGTAFFSTGPIVPFGYYGPHAWYGPGAFFPVVPIPVAQPPIIINNIVQPPPRPAVPDRPLVIPAEFERPLPKAVPGKPQLGPAPAAIEPKPLPFAARAASDRAIEAGRKAFGDGQYGRALELFRKAADVTPNEPSVHYLASQALFAMGKYREAAIAIAVGMTLRADWPDARFESRDLYAKKPAAFEEHRRALEEAVRANGEEADVLFLLGHQLWFDGERDRARAVFTKVQTLGKKQFPVETFLSR